MTSIGPFIVGNWKMNGLGSAIGEAVAIADGVRAAQASARVALCPPATLIERMSRAVAGSPVEIGGQDCSAHASGAFTGEISAQMLADAGARLAIVGHSERRQYHGETSQLVAAKALAASAAGLEPIICIGETLAEHESGETLGVVADQIAASVPSEMAGRPLTLAYEPVWAVGAGVTPTPDQIAQVHAHARLHLVRLLGESGQAVAILYGGSVKPANASELLGVPGVGGVLVGGASLKAAEFMAIVEASV